MDVVGTVSANLHACLNEELDQLARDCNVVLRERVFTGRTLLLMIVGTLLRKPDANWADFHQTAAQLKLKVSLAAVVKRFDAGQPLVDFFRNAFEIALEKSVAAMPDTASEFQQFTAVFVGDATAISLPDELAELFAGCGGCEGTSNAALKLQVLWDLKSGKLARLLVEAGKASDAKSPITQAELAAGNLVVFDLGYFDLDRLSAVDKAKAKFISRLQHGTSTFQSNGEPLNLLTYFYCS